MKSHAIQGGKVSAVNAFNARSVDAAYCILSNRSANMSVPCRKSVRCGGSSSQQHTRRMSAASRAIAPVAFSFGGVRKGRIAPAVYPVCGLTPCGEPSGSPCPSVRSANPHGAALPLAGESGSSNLTLGGRIMADQSSPAHAEAESPFCSSANVRADAMMFVRSKKERTGLASGSRSADEPARTSCEAAFSCPQKHGTRAPADFMTGKPCGEPSGSPFSDCDGMPTRTARPPLIGIGESVSTQTTIGGRIMATSSPARSGNCAEPEAHSYSSATWLDGTDVAQESALAHIVQIMASNDPERVARAVDTEVISVMDNVTDGLRFIAATLAKPADKSENTSTPSAEECRGLGSIVTLLADCLQLVSLADYQRGQAIYHLNNRG